MITALIYLTCSTLTLAVIARVFRVEDSRSGSRVVLINARQWFDRIVTEATLRLSKADTYLGRGFARLMLHYAAHGVLHRLLLFVGRMEKKVEHLLRSNKKVAKEIRINKEKTHLDKIADHREEVALTEEQKTKMRSHE
jgi:hypothetical protein